MSECVYMYMYMYMYMCVCVCVSECVGDCVFSIRACYFCSSTE